MARVYIAEIGRHVGETVTLRGWLYNKRHKGKLYFLLVRDGTETIQCVAYRPDVAEDVFARCDEVTQESSVEVTGTAGFVWTSQSHDAWLSITSGARYAVTVSAARGSSRSPSS